MSSDLKFDALVEQCYACVLDSGAWQSLLGQLIASSGRQSAGLLFWDQHSSGPRAGSVSMFSEATIRAYNEHYYALDPSQSYMAHRDAGVWYHDVAEMGIGRIRRDPFYDYFRQVEGLQNISCLKLYEQDHVGAYLSLLTLQGAKAPEQEHQELLQRMAPHLTRAGRLSERIRALELDIARRDVLLDRHDAPIWLVDEKGHVVYANLAAEAWLATTTCPLSIKHGYLINRAARDKLQELIRAATGQGRFANATRAGWLPATAPDQADLLVTPLPAHEAERTHDGRPLALVLSPRRTFRAELLRDIFQFTAAECLLAERMGSGASPEQCALALGISIHTVRTQLRALFRKTGTERQAELVSFLHRIGAS